jgi:hypothetical protein
LGKRFWSRGNFAVPGTSLLASVRNCPRSFPIGLTGLPPVEFLAESSGYMDDAGATLPSPSSFLELAGSGVFGVATLAFFSMPAIQLESQTTSRPL